MLCISIGRLFCIFFLRANTNTLSHSRVFLTCNFKLCMSTNRICLLCCFWKLDAHQPVKPPFSTAFNKTIRFIWNGNKVMRCAKPCYFMLYVLLHSSRLRLRHFSICYSRFCYWMNLFRFVVDSFNLSIAIISFSFVHTICAMNIQCIYAYWSALSVPNKIKPGKKKVQIDSIQFMFVSAVVCV